LLGQLRPQAKLLFYRPVLAQVRGRPVEVS
jgi:hypothetical protein